MKRIFENPKYVDPEEDTVCIRHEITDLELVTYRDQELVGVMVGSFEEIEKSIKYFLDNGFYEVKHMGQ